MKFATIFFILFCLNLSAYTNSQIANAIADVSKTQGVGVKILYTIIKIESNFEPFAISFLTNEQNAKYFKKLKDKKLKDKFAEAIKKIKENPEIGDMKKSDLAGIYGYDIFYNKINYELAYTIKIEDKKIVIVLLAGTRENFYKTLKKYLKSQ